MDKDLFEFSEIEYRTQATNTIVQILFQIRSCAEDGMGSVYRRGGLPYSLLWYRIPGDLHAEEEQGELCDYPIALDVGIRLEIQVVSPVVRPSR